MEFVIEVSKLGRLFLLDLGALFLHSGEILVELVLNQKVISDTLVKRVDFDAFSLKLLILALVQL